jgi:hypothetical protein
LLTARPTAVHWDDGSEHEMEEEEEDCEMTDGEGEEMDTQ